MNAIEFKSVSKQYHRKDFIFSKSDLFWVVKNLTFSIKKGEVVGLIGKNGSGKTTLMRLISQIIYPTRGSVHTTGKVVPLLSAEGCLHTLFNAKENISLLMALYGIEAKYEKKASDKIIEFSGLGDFMEMPINKFSMGMVSRLTFSIAIHLPFDILLVDEVLSAGDNQFQELCLRKIEELRKEGRTILFASHLMEDVERICNRVLWLEKGELKGAGLPSEVIPIYLDHNQLTPDAKVSTL